MKYWFMFAAWGKTVYDVNKDCLYVVWVLKIKFTEA